MATFQHRYNVSAKKRWNGQTWNGVLFSYQLAFTCPKLTIETLEKGMKYARS